MPGRFTIPIPSLEQVLDRLEREKESLKEAQRAYELAEREALGSPPKWVESEAVR